VHLVSSLVRQRSCWGQEATRPLPLPLKKARREAPKDASAVGGRVPVMAGHASVVYLGFMRVSERSSRPSPHLSPFRHPGSEPFAAPANLLITPPSGTSGARPASLECRPREDSPLALPDHRAAGARPGTIDHRPVDGPGVSDRTRPTCEFFQRKFAAFPARSGAWIDLLSAERPGAGCLGFRR
jgi:hypothetical protein